MKIFLHRQTSRGHNSNRILPVGMRSEEKSGLYLPPLRDLPEIHQTYSTDCSSTVNAAPLGGIMKKLNANWKQDMFKERLELFYFLSSRWCISGYEIDQ